MASLVALGDLSVGLALASFGGFVAQSYATRHPDKIGALILSVTAAKVDFETMFAAFARRGGAAAEAAAEAAANAGLGI